MIRLWMLSVALMAQLLAQATKEVDAWQLAVVADSLHIPRVVMWGVAWEETRTGISGNKSRGPGIIRYDSLGKAHHTCREIGRMQLKPCQDWTYLSPDCTTRNLYFYKWNVWCGALNLRHKYEKYGDWIEAIRSYNGEGAIANAYRDRVLHTIGRFSLLVPQYLLPPQRRHRAKG